MLTTFSTPVLSISSDAVKNLEGRDSLLGLWTLFTKCKESLQDGRRLENISWRLWYREVMRDGSMNRLSQGNVNEKEEQDHLLRPHGPHTPTDLYRPLTPSESTPPLPPYVVQEVNGSNGLPLSDRPPLLPQDHNHATSPPSRLGPTQVSMFRSNSSIDPARCPPLDSASAALQMSKSKLNSDTVLSPEVPVYPFLLSSSSSGSQPRDFTDVPTHVSSIQLTQRRLNGFPAQIQRRAPAPVFVGKIICDMLPCSATNGNETSRLKVWPSSLTTTTPKLTSVDSMPTPVVDSSNSLQLPAVVPTISAGLPIERTSGTMNVGTTNSKYSTLHTAPPSPSLSDSYARAHPGEVEVLDVTRLDVAVGPSLSHHPGPYHHQQVKSEKQLEPQIIPGEEVAERQLQKQEKGKGREHSNPKPNNNTKHSTHETLNMVSSALAAKVKHTLADPLLPGQHKRTIVLTTSESEDEHSEDDGSCWSSEEMGSEDEEEGRRQERQRHDRLLALQQQQQLQQLHQRPPPVLRTHSSPRTHSSRTHSSRTHSSNQPLTTIHNLNRANGANGIQRTRTSRGHRHPPNHTQGQTLAQAAQEAQRQRDMFVKKPTESFQNLTQVARTQSVGLLTQLLNPNPEIFPVGHPYRRGNSSSEIRGVAGRANTSKGDRDRDRGFTPLQPLMDVKATKMDNVQDNNLDTRPPPSRPEAVPRKSSSPSVHPRAALSPPARPLSMQRTKSAVAMPVSSPQVQTGSMSHTFNAVVGGGHGDPNGIGKTNMKMVVSSNHSSGGYRPKGRPLDQELEDESGSEAEFGSQVSRSVAQEKLKALAERRGVVTCRKQSTITNGTTSNVGGADTKQKDQPGDEGDVPHWAKVSEPRPPTRTRSHAKVSKPRPPIRTRSHDQYPQSQAPGPNANRRSLNAYHFSQMITSTPSQPAPIPVNHPYNLPPPAPPSTPRTTRRLMLSTELSESLRRNLLWERQVSKVNLAAIMRRTASSGGSRLSNLGGLQPLQPLTTAPSLVQLLPKGTMAYPNPGSPVESVRPRLGSSEGDGNIKKERRASGGAGDHPGPSVLDEKEKEQKRSLVMARNRSWANDYHFAGW